MAWNERFCNSIVVSSIPVRTTSKPFNQRIKGFFYAFPKGNLYFYFMGFESEINQIIAGIGSAGKMGNVMEVLGYSQKDFQTGFDIANEMQNRDLVKLLYSNYNQNKIVVEFTLLGKAAYEKMAV